MLARLAAALIGVVFLTLAASAQQAAEPVENEPARAGVLVTLTENGELILTPSALIELENGMQLQRDSSGRWVVGGIVIALRELTANPFQYDARRITVTGGSVANVLPDYGFLQYSNLLNGGTVTVITRGVPDPVLAPYAAGCQGFVTDDIPICKVSVTGTVSVNEADNTVELTDPVFITR
jgi:hypothetical protein